MLAILQNVTDPQVSITFARLINSIYLNTEEWESYISPLRDGFIEATEEHPGEIDYLSLDTIYSITRLFYSKFGIEVDNYISPIIDICVEILNVPGNEINSDIDVVKDNVDQSIMILLLSHGHVISGGNNIDEMFHRLRLTPYSLLSLVICRWLLNYYLMADPSLWNINNVEYLTSRLSDISDDLNRLLIRFINSM